MVCLCACGVTVGLESCAGAVSSTSCAARVRAFCVLEYLKFYTRMQPDNEMYRRAINTGGTGGRAELAVREQHAAVNSRRPPSHPLASHASSWGCERRPRPQTPLQPLACNESRSRGDESAQEREEEIKLPPNYL